MSSNRQKRISLALAAIAAFVIVLVSASPSQAFTSLQGCAQDPACNAFLAAEMKANTVALTPAQNLITPIASSVGGTASSPFPWGVVGGTGAGMGLFAPTAQQLEDLRKKAVTNLCQSDPNNPACIGASPTGLYVFRVGRVGETYPPGYSPWGFMGASASVFNNSRYYGVVIQNYNGQGRVEEIELDSSPVRIVETLCYFGGGSSGPCGEAPPWESLPDSQRQAAVDALTPSDWGDFINGMGQVGSTLSPGDTVNAPNVIALGGPGADGIPGNSDDEQPQKLPGPYTVPAPAPPPAKDTDGDGIPDSEDPDIDGDGLPNSSDPDIDGDGVPNSEDPDYNPSAGGLTGEVPTAAKPAQFNKPNFLQYGWQVFSNKFPLDVVGDLPAADDPNACPTFTFWGTEFTLCIVRDAIRMVKVPAIISFIIWAILVL